MGFKVINSLKNKIITILFKINLITSLRKSHFFMIIFLVILLMFSKYLGINFSCFELFSISSNFSSESFLFLLSLNLFNGKILLNVSFLAILEPWKNVDEVMENLPALIVGYSDISLLESSYISLVYSSYRS